MSDEDFEDDSGDYDKEDAYSNYDEQETESNEKGEAIHFDWDTVLENDQIFILKIGEDRGQEEREFGPFSVDMIRKLIRENRINQKMLVIYIGKKYVHMCYNQ